MNELKLNFGSGPKKIEGYTSVDGLEWGGTTDVLVDFNYTPYPFEDNSADEIMMVEFLEHLNINDANKCIKECFRILKTEGLLKIQVPDIGKMCEYYVGRQICDCVPHKDNTGKFAADPECPDCGGTAKINPVRWAFAFAGAQKHEYDTHKSHFTVYGLSTLLFRNGFEPNGKYKLSVIDNIYKIIIHLRKPKI